MLSVCFVSQDRCMVPNIGHDEASGPAHGARLIGRLFEGIERFGSATALVREDGSSVSYAELAQLADTAAQAIGPERALISVEMQNDVQSIAFYIGALRAGHVVIASAGEGVHSIEQTFKPNAAYVCAGGIWKLTALSRERADMSPDLAVLLSTSGSTGSQKLVRLSHENLRSNALAIAEYLEFQPGERAITSLPAHYSFGLSVLHTHLLLGHTLVLTDRSVAEPAFWDIVDREGVTSIAGVPHSYQLLELGGFLERDHKSLRYLTQAGGKLSPESVQKFAQWADRSGKRFYVMYGQTEAAPRMAYLPPADAAAYPDCVGVAVPGGSFHLEPIEDAEGLPEGAGELVYKGPNVMMGYAVTRADLAKPQGTDEIHTGDIAVRNERGYYRIVGRISRFAKLFGLRLGFDDIERRLAAEGVSAAVSGDDSGIVVASTTPGSEARVPGLLAQDLGIPASLITAVEVGEIPRLPSGKTDYATIRSYRPEPGPIAATTLGAAIASVLGRDNLDPRWSFTEAGGDSLNYVQMVLTLERFLGHVPDNWANMPIGDLVAMQEGQAPGAEDALERNPSVSIQGLDLARTIAIFLALMAHSFTQVFYILPPELSFISRIPTPMLIVLFGAMIPLLYIPRSSQTDPGETLQDYVTKSLQCYALYAVNVFAIWVIDPSGWMYALGSLALLGAMPYAQILVFYTIMFLLIPAIVYALKRFNFWALFAASLAVHAAFMALKMVPTPPKVAGQPILQRLMDLVVGAGAAPEVAGPSILHSFVLLMAGIWIGDSIRRSGEHPSPRRHFARMQLPLAAVFALALVYAFSIPGYTVDWDTLTNLQLRNLNHPAYVFVFGGICVLLLWVLLVAPLSNRAPRWLMAMGRRSLFAFGIGNAIIVLWPRGGFPFLPPLADGLIILSSLMVLIYAFDYCMRAGRDGTGVARWVFTATNAGSRFIGGLAKRIVGVGRR
ncbi:AMP-binding enzyme [Hyphomonas neptunium ATCC 15444]|uniref:AMP-binding enzyme n=2 Tax=Hyphomonas TaxID=85 RepID=Q0BZ05_HYPNA|nr:AMP-binding enzyme [Hyphomonas neptunium ATCC 15444]